MLIFLYVGLAVIGAALKALNRSNASCKEILLLPAIACALVLLVTIALPLLMLALYAAIVVGCVWLFVA